VTITEDIQKVKVLYTIILYLATYGNNRFQVTGFRCQELRKRA